MTRRVAVTGATGFVGRALCKHLAESGWQVVPISRFSGEIAGEAPVVIRDLADRDALARAFAGVDAFIHLAARVHVMHERAADPLTEYRRVNVEGTGVACEEAVRAGVQRVVYVSSVKVHGEGKSTPYRASDPPAPGDPYSQSKLEAEQVVANAVRGRASWTVLRPPLVYGPGVGGNFRRLVHVADLARRIPLPLGAIENRRSMIALPNLAAALACCAQHAAAANQSYLISDGEDLSTSLLISKLAVALGGRALLLPYPDVVAGALGKLLGRQDEIARLTGSLTVDGNAIRHELGWHPAVSVDEALAEIGEWWRRRRE